jgi:hypothetical protein
LPDTTVVTVSQRIPVTLNANGADAFLVISNFEFSLTDTLSPLSFGSFSSPYFTTIYQPMCHFYSYGSIELSTVKFTPAA